MSGLGIDAFVEGVRSIHQVCHLVILAPVALTIVAARGRWPAVAGSIVGVVAGGWLFVTNRLGSITDTQLRVTAVLLIVAVLGLAFPRTSFAARIETAPVTAGISAAVAVMVTQWWRPCVGEQLGSILTNAPRDPWGELLPSSGFMLGVSAPLIVIGLIYAAWNPDAERSVGLGRLTIAGATLCVVLGLSVVAGQHGEIVSRLFQWSQ